MLYFYHLYICLLGTKCIKAGQILSLLAYLFIEQTLMVYYHTSSLCIQYLPFLWLGSQRVFTDIKTESYPFYWSKISAIFRITPFIPWFMIFIKYEWFADYIIYCSMRNQSDKVWLHIQNRYITPQSPEYLQLTSLTILQDLLTCNTSSSCHIH